MKRLTALCYMLLCCLPCIAQDNYDKKLADSLGADAYGMKMYTMVILKTGPTTITDKKVTDSLFKGHMANINKLVGEGKLVVAGPFSKNELAYRGIFILNVKTKADAELLLKGDPAIGQGLLAADIIPWYGSAALPLYLKEHGRIEQKKP